MADMTGPLTNARAQAIATAWIHTNDHLHAAAFIGGSAATVSPDTLYDPTSDIDCYLVIDGPPPPGKIGKVTVGGVLLDVSWLPWSHVETARTNAIIASLLNFGRVIHDPTGRLEAIQLEIQGSFATPAAIWLRLEDMRQRIRAGLTADTFDLPQPEQMMNWLFPATLATHLPLIAACAPLTVRKRFLATKQVTTSEVYEELLSLYGFADVTREQTQQWLDLTDRIFSENAALAETSSRFWAGDIRKDARAIAIGGSQQLIEAGLHREALYWIIATCSRCLVVRADAGAVPSTFLSNYHAMLAKLALLTPDHRDIKSTAILDWIDTAQFN